MTRVRLGPRKPKMIIDSNIFLELELGQEKSEDCKEVLRKLDSGEINGIISDFQVDSILVVMENYKKRGSDLRKFLLSIFALEGLDIYTLSIYDKIKATEHMDRYNLDFDDALAYQTMHINNVKTICSYDTHFDKLDGIKRIEPSTQKKK